MGGLTLVRAGGLQVARPQFHPHVIRRKVVPHHGKRALEEPSTAIGVGQHDAFVFQPDASGTLPDVDAVERVPRVPDDRLVLLPPVERAEIQFDIAGEIGVVQPEAGARPRPVRGWTVSDSPSAVCTANGTVGSSSLPGPGRSQRSGTPVGLLGTGCSEAVKSASGTA